MSNHFKDEKTRKKEIENKINHEKMNSDDFKYYFNLQDPYNKMTNEIKSFCKHYNINRNDLKDGKKYSFKPLWNGYFFLLFDIYYYDHPLFHGNKNSSNITFDELAELDIKLTKKSEKYLPEKVLSYYRNNYLYKSSKVRKLIIDELDKKLENLKEMIRLNPVNILIDKYDDLVSSIKNMEKVISTDPSNEGYSKRMVLDGKMTQKEYNNAKEFWYKSNKYETFEEQVLSDFKFLLNLKEDPTVKHGIIESDEVEFKEIDNIHELLKDNPDDEFIDSIQLLYFTKIDGRPIPKKMKTLEKKLK